MGLIDSGFSLMVLIFFLANSVVGTLIHFRLNFSILDSLCKNIPLKIRIIDETNKR